MSFLDLTNRIERVDSLIRLRATGCPKTLARKLGLTERSVYNLIDLMKNLGAPIEYDLYLKTYYYKEEGKFSFNFLKNDDLKRIIGGLNVKNNTEKIFQYSTICLKYI